MVEGEVAIYPSGEEQNTISQIKEKGEKNEQPLMKGHFISESNDITNSDKQHR